MKVQMKKMKIQRKKMKMMNMIILFQIFFIFDKNIFFKK